MLYFCQNRNDRQTDLYTLDCVYGIWKRKKNFTNSLFSKKLSYEKNLLKNLEKSKFLKSMEISSQSEKKINSTSDCAERKFGNWENAKKFFFTFFFFLKNQKMVWFSKTNRRESYSLFERNKIKFMQQQKKIRVKNIQKDIISKKNQHLLKNHKNIFS